MVEFLLTHPNIEIGDNVLHAIHYNSIKILEMLLNAQSKISPGLEFAGTTHSTDYPAHVTPLILAAQMGHYELVSLLIDRGHCIARPHVPNCRCIACKNSLVNEDPLHASSARLSVYRAIASPAYLVHVSSDPILTAFRLTAELADNAAAYRHIAGAYLQLSDDVSAFAVDLIGCCRTSEEVEFILKQKSGCRGRRHFVLPRLLMAVDYRQKEFVAHPNTQQVLESYWLGDWHNWRSKYTRTKAMIILYRVFITPIILIVCMVAPRHRLVRHWQIPLNKLITHVAAYFVFLALVFYISNQDKSLQKRGPPNTGAEAPIILYVCGYTWSALRMIVMQGPHRYFSKMWNWAEIIMLTMFGLTFVFWVAAAIDIAIRDQEDLGFEVISVIVVLNMLIATMSNTFQRVNDNVDIEWTFGKTEVYIDYMLQTTLPSPFNLIPTASGMGNVVEWFCTKIKRPPGVYARWSPYYCCYIERDVEASVLREYPALMSVLVQRYFRDKDSSQIIACKLENELTAMRRNLDAVKISR